MAAGATSAAGQSHNISTVAGDGSAGAPGAVGDGGPASQAQISVPVSVKVLPDGGYLIFHQGGSLVRRVLPDGTITTVAGNGTAAYTGDGGPATSASMNAPSGGAVTADGGYLIADANNNAIRRVAPDGTMTTAVGNGGGAFSGDGGPATAAQVRFPYDVAVQPDGGYLIADTDNNRVRRVAPDGIITTVAGGGGALGDGGPATAAQLAKPSGLALTPDGGYLIAETSGNRVRKVSFDGTITTVAGTGTAGATGDGGPATAAQLNSPGHLAVTPDGGFVFADELNHELRRVAADGTISTVAGTGSAGFGGDGGAAIGAQLNAPLGAAVTLGGDYLIADTNNQRIRLVDADPPPPVLASSSPVSPAANGTPRILGSAPPGTTVALFPNDTCTAPSAAGGSAAELAAPGIVVTVPAGRTTTFHALATDSAGNSSPCSTTSVTYVNSSSPALPPPVRGRLVNAVPEKGKVLVKVPGKGFVPLASLGRQLPVGATLDTRKGTVALTSAKDAHGATQIGHFSKGVFKFTQTKKNPLTVISMTGGGLNACSKLPPGGSPKAVAATKRRRTLFSNVKGRFRTRGRNSAATVRGTSWSMTDTCGGTTTAVKTGSVEVRDFRLRKTKLVRAGHSYLARAPLRKKPRR